MRFRAVAVVAMLIRPPVAGVVLLFAALGVAAAGAAETAHPLFTTVLVILAGWFVNAAALNDLADEQIDRVNLPSARGRPLVSGHATRRELGVVAAVAAVVALGVAAAVGWPVVLVVAAGLAINAAYSLRPFRVSRRGVLAPLTVAAGFVVVPYLIGVLSVTRSHEPAELALLPGLYVAFVGRILLKDFRDAAGDAMFGKWTFLLRHGRVTTCAASAACWIAGAAAVVAALPEPSVIGALAVAFVLCALHGLARLAAEPPPDPIAEQVVIGAIAQAGRGLCIVVLAHLTMLDQGWPPGPHLLVLTAIGVAFVVAYVATYAVRGRVTAIRPY